MTAARVRLFVAIVGSALLTGAALYLAVPFLVANALPAGLIGIVGISALIAWRLA